MLEGKSSNSEPNRWRSNSPQGRRLAAVEKSKKKDQLMSRRKFLGTALLGVAALSLKKFMDSADWVLDNREVEQGKSSEDETMSEEEKLRAALEGVKERVLTREQEEAIEKEVVEGTIKEQLIVNKQVDIEKAKAAIYKKWYKLYSPGGVEHPGLLESLSDMQPWLSELEEVFRRQQVPETLIYLAIPESNFVFRRVSPAGACGPYQFMRNTAKGYNLRCDDIIDERFDPIKSAEAAASYLLDLYNQFGGEWKLALAAYNGGYANKYRVAKGSNTEEMSYSDYLKYREKNINDYINENEEQGFYLHEVERGETLSSLARRYKITVEEIRQKNKKMVDAKTTRIKEGDVIKLPLNNSVMLQKLSSALENLNYPEKFFAIWQVIEDYNLREKFPASKISYETFTLPKEKKMSLSVKVNKGDNLTGIAQKLRVKMEQVLPNSAPKVSEIVSLLQKQNRLRGAKDIHPGQELKLMVNLKKLVTLEQIASNVNLDLGEVSELNPAIKKYKTGLPAGQEIRLPKRTLLSKK